MTFSDLELSRTIHFCILKIFDGVFLQAIAIPLFLYLPYFINLMKFSPHFPKKDFGILKGGESTTQCPSPFAFSIAHQAWRAIKIFCVREMTRDREREIDR